GLSARRSLLDPALDHVRCLAGPDEVPAGVAHGAANLGTPVKRCGRRVGRGSSARVHDHPAVGEPDDAGILLHDCPPAENIGIGWLVRAHPFLLAYNRCLTTPLTKGAGRL